MKRRPEHAPAESADPDYPGHWERRRVRHDGRVQFQGWKYFLSEALARESVGLIEVDEDVWQLWFGPVEIALFDAANRELWPLTTLFCYLSVRSNLLPIRPVIHSLRCP